MPEGFGRKEAAQAARQDKVAFPWQESQVSFQTLYS